MNENEKIPKRPKRQSDWIRQSVLFWSSRTGTPCDERSNLTSASGSSIETANTDEFDPTVLLQQVEEYEHCLREFSSNLSLCESFSEEKSSPHLTLEFPSGSSVKSNPIFKDNCVDKDSGIKKCDTNNDNRSFESDLREKISQTLEDDRNTSNINNIKGQSPSNEIRANVNVVQDTLNEIANEIKSNEMRFRRDPNEVLRNLLLRIKPPDEYEDTSRCSSRLNENSKCFGHHGDLQKIESKGISFDEKTEVDGSFSKERIRLKEIDNMEFENEKECEIDFKSKFSSRDSEYNNNVRSRHRSVSSDSNSPYPSPLNQRSLCSKSKPEECDSGYSDNIPKDVKKISAPNTEPLKRKEFLLMDEDDLSSDWSPVSTLSSTYKSRTSTMERPRSFSVPKISFPKLSPKVHRNSTGRMLTSDKTFENTIDESYSESELHAIRKFLALTSKYFDQPSPVNEQSNIKFDDEIALPSIKEAIDKQKMELHIQKEKQEEFLRQLGDMLIEIVSLKEDHFSVRTKQAKALGLLKRQLDIQKKHQSKAHNDVVHQVETLTKIIHESPLSQSVDGLATPNNIPLSPRVSLSKIGTSGFHIWKLSETMSRLTRIKSGLMEDVLVSPPFLTDTYGYKMTSWLYLNGRGRMRDTYISIYVCVVVGEYDAILPWPIKPTYSFTLIDQRGDILKREDHVKVRRVMDIADKGNNLIAKHGGIPRPSDSTKALIVGFDDFISHEKLLERRYLIDDTIFVRIEADVVH